MGLSSDWRGNGLVFPIVCGLTTNKAVEPPVAVDKAIKDITHPLCAFPLVLGRVATMWAAPHRGDFCAL